MGLFDKLVLNGLSFGFSHYRVGKIILENYSLRGN